MHEHRGDMELRRLQRRFGIRRHGLLRLSLHGDGSDRADGQAGAAAGAGLRLDPSVRDAAGGECETNCGVWAGILATAAHDPLG